MAGQAILQDWGNRSKSPAQLSPSLEYATRHPRWEKDIKVGKRRGKLRPYPFGVFRESFMLLRAASLKPSL